MKSEVEALTVHWPVDLNGVALVVGNAGQCMTLHGCQPCSLLQTWSQWRWISVDAQLGTGVLAPHPSYGEACVVSTNNSVFLEESSRCTAAIEGGAPDPAVVWTWDSAAGQLTGQGGGQMGCGGLAFLTSEESAQVEAGTASDELLNLTASVDSVHGAAVVQMPALHLSDEPPGEPSTCGVLQAAAVLRRAGCTSVEGNVSEEIACCRQASEFASGSSWTLAGLPTQGLRECGALPPCALEAGSQLLSALRCAYSWCRSRDVSLARMGWCHDSVRACRLPASSERLQWVTTEKG
mmetsp:Transcript_17240/g.42272  ORF Transcript_17240/g.42272 Transcript_17240/m.42272 type:complete len:294 (+) Transcript_17240:1-882(+)